MVLRGKTPSGRKPSTSTTRRVLAVATYISCLAPIGWLVYLATSGALGANPIEAINRFLGDWALRFLLVSLAITPIKNLLNWPLIMTIRRKLGLFAFTYVALHVGSYIALDQFFNWADIWADIVKRNYITVGAVAFFMLVPLAVTSTSRMIKRLGALRWKRLHMLIYPATVLACVHYIMMVKADIREPLIYAAILAALLGYRLLIRLRTGTRVFCSSRRAPSASVNRCAG